MTSREIQLEYELQADNEAAAAKLEALNREAAEGRADLPRAQQLVASAFGVVRDNIQAAMDTRTNGKGGIFKGWLRAIPVNVAAVIALRECISMCSTSVMKGPATVQALAIAVGKLYETEVRIAEATGVNPVYMNRITTQIGKRNSRDAHHIRGVYNKAYDAIMKTELNSSLSNTEALHLGKFGVDACVQAGIIQLVKGRGKRGNLYYYELNPEVSEFLTSYTDKDVRGVLSVESGAMLCPPDPWTKLNDGGYLSPRRKVAAPLMSLRYVRKSERDRLWKLFTAEHLPLIFKVANYLQAQPFQIHQPTFEAVNRIWKTGGGVLGVPLTTGPSKPEFPLGEDWEKEGASDEDMDWFLSWKRKAAEYYDELREWRGKVREIGGFIKAVRKTQDHIWFPVYFDRRGRWYYRGVPNPQGSDIAKACIHLGTAKALGERGVYWLKVHIANSFGFDKERLDKRAAWTEANWEAIERALDAPEDYPDVWGTEAPWCMFSAAWELREAYRSGNARGYKCSIPIHMDATCSGLQHFAALLKDETAAVYVNLIDPPRGEKKADIYTRVSTMALARAQIDTQEGSDTIKANALRWLSSGVERGLAKKPVMTYCYSATLMGATHSVRAYVEKETPQFIVKGPEAFDHYQYMAKKLFKGIELSVPSAVAAMRWLKTSASSQPKGKRMEWRAPTGFPVQHDYQDYSETRIEIKSCGIKQVLVREYNEDTRGYAMQNAISPNFVHSLDASHLTFVADAMQDAGLSLVGIHDSFGTHPCDVDQMHRIIREQFVRLYSHPETILQNYATDVGYKGELPKLGNLDITQVIDSEFFFS